MVRFSTREFFRSHGKEPRGRGSWAFQVEDTTKVVFSPSMTFSEAKAWMRKQVAAARNENVYVDVLP